MSLCPRSDLNRRVLNDVQDSLRLVRQTIDLLEKRLDRLTERLDKQEQPVLASWSTLPDRIEELESIVAQRLGDELARRKPSQSRKAAAATIVATGASTAKIEPSEG